MKLASSTPRSGSLVARRRRRYRGLRPESLESRELLALTITGASLNANALRDALIGPGVVPVGDATLLSGPASAGFYTGGATSIGIESGIVLSSGDVSSSAGPNVSDFSSGFASFNGYAPLDNEFGVVTFDTTVLSFDFLVAESTLVFDYVFASEEYNEFVDSEFNDVFAFFLDGQNIALIPGTNTPVSVNTVNNGFPFGAGGANSQFYRNNDLDDGGQFITEFGLDGFTTVFQAVQVDLDPGVHTITLAVGDVADEIYDTAVFLRASSFQSVPLDEIQGVKFRDDNANGLQDVGEPGLPGFYIYVDLDRNGQISLGEPAAITGEFGQFEIPNVPHGTHVIREVPQPGYVLTFPTENDGGHLVTLAEGEPVPTLFFANSPAVDFGDAPQPFPTLAIDGGPSHGLFPNFHLGPSAADGGVGVDADLDGYQDPDFPQLLDDTTNLDDEDGIVFVSPIAAGLNATVQVTVTTGNSSAGYLQGWIDFNRDGDWDDPGEQIVRNAFLGQGVHNLNFNVPLSAVGGPTNSRFRYSYHQGLAYTGHASAGEVEDHVTAVLIDTPQAVDDLYHVVTDSADNELDVLANDLTSVAGFGTPLSLVFVTQPAHGTVVIDRRGTGSDPSDDVLLYTPDARFLGTDTFTYTILDDVTGTTDTATVTVVVELPDTALAVDNYFAVDEDSANNVLDVLANDLVGPDGTLSIVSFTSPPSGTVNFGTGNQTLLYTPDAGFQGKEQFEYTIRDDQGNTDSATVTVDVGDTFEQQGEMAIRLELTDTEGNALPGGVVTQGDEFVVRAYVQDVRNLTDVPAPPPFDQGVFSSYFDLLYDATLVSVGEIQFGPEYPAARNFRPEIPGIVDEVGALQGSGAMPLGPSEVLLFELTMSADFPGQTILQADPADDLPLHETLLNTPTDPDRPSLTFEEIAFGSATVNVQPAPDLVGFTLIPTDLVGNPIVSVRPGDQFLVQGMVQDLRDPPRLSGGVFSAYADVLFDPALLRVDEIGFGDDFPTARNAQVSPGLIDEIGAVHSTGPPLGLDPVLLFEITFTALTPGISALRSNAADILPLHETILQDQAPEAVPPSRISYGAGFVSITAAPPAQFTNPENRLDVNADGEVGPMDVLIAINDINRHGARSVAEAESSEIVAYVDVNGDGRVDPQDVLAIINYLNKINVGVVAEGEAAWIVEAADAVRSGGLDDVREHPLERRNPGADRWIPVLSPRKVVPAEAELPSERGTSNDLGETADDWESLLTTELLTQVARGWRESRGG